MTPAVSFGCSASRPMFGASQSSISKEDVANLTKNAGANGEIALEGAYPKVRVNEEGKAVRVVIEAADSSLSSAIIRLNADGDVLEARSLKAGQGATPMNAQDAAEMLQDVVLDKLA